MTNYKVLKVKGNRSGYRALLNSKECQTMLDNLGNEIATKANGDYLVTTQVGKVRSHTRVAVNSRETLNDNLENNTLLKAVG